MEAELPRTEPPRTERSRQRRVEGRKAVDPRPIQHSDLGLVELYLAQLRQRAGWSRSPRGYGKSA